jgi:RNA polymerase sigma-70 factor, ECF subfamily
MGAMTRTPGRVTSLLREAAAGDSSAEQDLLHLVHAELKRIALRRMRGERKDHTLQPTALVNEAYVRLLRGGPQTWNDRTHFLAVASNVMRRILVDHARRRTAHKSQRLEEPPKPPAVDAAHSPDTILAVDEALAELARSDARQARIVEMRFFSGLTDEEVATVLEISVRTVKRDWAAAKAWLYARLRQ